MTKIMLVDDHQIVRKGLRALLSGESDFEVVGEASCGIEALEVATQLQPDILILDLMMPGMSGLEVTLKLTQVCPKIRVIILSMYDNEAYVIEALNSGARGYVPKDNTADELIAAIRKVRDGSIYLSSSLQIRTIQNNKEKTAVNDLDPIAQLTSREQEIMRLAINGFSNNEIASKLSISQRTVETHCTNFMHKLGVNNRNQLFQMAVRRGIIKTGNFSIGNSPSVSNY